MIPTILIRIMRVEEKKYIKNSKGLVSEYASSRV
jgi:hypothetical protein